MKKLLGGFLLIILLLTGCSAVSKSSDRADACMTEMTTDIACEAALYSMERKADAGSGASDFNFTDTPLVYVTFSQYSDNLSADDGTKLFTAACYVPEFRTDDAQLDAWLATCVEDAAAGTLTDLNWTRERALTDYADGEDDLFYAYSYYSNVNTERIDNRIISVLQINSAYSGGAHPNYAQYAYNLDLVSRRLLNLSDVIEPGGEEVLLERVLNELQDRFGGIDGFGLFPGYELAVENCFVGPELTNNWYFEDNGLVIYFNCYEIAPYAAGIIKVNFDYHTLHGVLRADYFPESIGSEEGRVIVLNNPQGYRIISVPSEGEQIYIGTDCVIYDLKIHQLSSWLADDMPIVGQMVFASNRLSWSEAVEVCDSTTHENPSYLISFRTGAGQMRIVGVGPGILREIIQETAE